VQMTDLEIARLVINAGFPDPVTAVAIVLAESGGDYMAKNVNHCPGKKWDNSVDSGLWQFNGYFFAGRVNDWVAYDPNASTIAAFWASNYGKNFNLWSSYNQGTYRKYLERAKIAVNGVK
jgi:hypothetical protein